jgi:cyclopropane fatty-acyl-phospholipid synthase-like methyltransferase
LPVHRRRTVSQLSCVFFFCIFFWWCVQGNDFFSAFLGPSMVYTSGIYNGLDQSLEEAQDNKMHEVCQRLRLKPGMTMLDIGCGWGTLARFAEKHYGAKVTAVTLSAEGARYCREMNKSENTNVQILEVCSRSPHTDCTVKMCRGAGVV